MALLSMRRVWFAVCVVGFMISFTACHNRPRLL